jgi:hypothetical protein
VNTPQFATTLRTARHPKEMIAGSTFFAPAHQHTAMDDLESARFNVPFKQKFHLAAGAHDLASQSKLRSWQRKGSRAVMLTVSSHSCHTARIQTGAMQYHFQVSQLLCTFLQYAVILMSNWP